MLLLKDSAKARLAEYVRARHKLPVATPVSVAEASVVGSTCYRKLQFTSEDAKRPFQMEMYASPDLGLTPRNLRQKLGAQVKAISGFNQARFESCVAERKTTAKVEHDLAFGKLAGVNATPTLFVNGQRLQNIVGPEQILTLIRQLGN